MWKSICNEDHPGKHFYALDESAEEHPALLLNVENKRIEIDSLIAIVRIKGFWKFIIETYIWNWNMDILRVEINPFTSGITLGSKKWVNKCLSNVVYKV